MATVKQNDPQAKADTDKAKVPDASEAAKSRGAEKGDVDVVKAQEKHNLEQGDKKDLVEDAHKRDDKAAEEKDKEAEDRDNKQAEALKAAHDAKGQPAPEELRSLADVRDGVDKVNRDWTVQSDRPYFVEDQEVGQAFTKAQLPNRTVQKDAGVDPDQWAAGVVVLDDDEATKDVHSGPEPWEARDLGLIKA